MEVQKSVSQLTQAVTTLTETSKDHGTELKSMGKDVHAAKVVVSVVGGLILLFGGVVAWLVNTYISTHPAK